MQKSLRATLKNDVMATIRFMSHHGCQIQMRFRSIAFGRMLATVSAFGRMPLEERLWKNAFGRIFEALERRDIVKLASPRPDPIEGDVKAFRTHCHTPIHTNR
jgi:hypothetical protein